MMTLPGGFRDRSQIVVDWPLADGRTLGLALQHGRLDPNVNLESHVESTTRDYPAKLLGYRPVEETHPNPLEGEATVVRRAFRWKNKAWAWYAHQVFFAIDQTLFILTASGPSSHRARIDAIVQEALAGFRLREE